MGFGRYRFTWGWGELKSKFTGTFNGSSLHWQLLDNPRYPPTECVRVAEVPAGTEQAGTATPGAEQGAEVTPTNQPEHITSTPVGVAAVGLAAALTALLAQLPQFVCLRIFFGRFLRL